MFVLDNASLVSVVIVAALTLFLVVTIAHAWCGSRIYATLTESLCGGDVVSVKADATTHRDGRDMLTSLAREGVMWADRCRREVMFWAVVLAVIGCVFVAYGTYYKRA